ncbi:sensor histidine kinase [[Clostridium] spiroforme]|nr:sensor histidine kinase [Thomasclavelia spiroformis]MBM6879178.1 sensor histidine kinase [Thomasclavelia spiroformis]
MNYLKYKHVNFIKDLQLLLNFVIIIYNASIFLAATNYICSNGYERAFLERISSVPLSPQKTFFEAIGLCLIIILIIKMKYFQNLKKKYNFVFYLELLLAIFVIYRLNGSYNGIILVILADIIANSKTYKHLISACMLYVFLFAITDYQLLAMFISLPSLETYISYLPITMVTMIYFFKNLLIIFNIVLFFLFLISYLFVQEKEKEHISEELEYVSHVNEQLKNYAALTEKIGEDNERKRISREIHDTLGHALTGILAGVDACRVLINIDTDKTKKQLDIVSDVVRQGIKDVRGSLNKLRPGALEETSLKVALEKMIKEFEEVSKLKIDFYYEWDRVDLEKTKEDIIFRIIQESITNALRHGKATEVEINMFNDDYKYMLVIQDNGVGCQEIHYGYGLKQMQERVAILDGKISFIGDNGFRTMVEFRK